MIRKTESEKFITFYYNNDVVLIFSKQNFIALPKSKIRIYVTQDKIKEFLKMFLIYNENKDIVLLKESIVIQGAESEFKFSFVPGIIEDSVKLTERLL